MNWEPKTIADQIECLAQLTGAPSSFIDQVRGLFKGKGISLDEDAEPYIKALDEAFRREESIRHSAARAQQSISGMGDQFNRIGKAYVGQLTELKKIQTSLKEQSRRLKSRLEMLRSGGDTVTQVTIRGDHRTYVTRPVREELPMVPGPEDLQ